MPTMKGRASRALARLASRRGISVSTYPTDSRTEAGVAGSANERRVDKVSGRGGCFACSSIIRDSSAGVKAESAWCWEWLVKVRK